MKKRNYIKSALISLTAIALLSSCLKDKERFVDFANAIGAVELPATAFSGELQVATFSVASTPSPLALLVNYASPKTSGTPINVTLAIDQPTLAAYNTANSTTYELLPAADYSISSLKVTIPAGQREMNLNIAINTSLIDLTKQYALPLTITDGGGQVISANYKTVIFAINVKNAYDGIYTLSGHFVDAASAAITDAGVYPYDVYLETQGANSVVLADPVKGLQHAINSGGVITSYGEFAPIFNFDPATQNVTSVVNYFGQPSPTRARAARIDPTGTNKLTGTPGTVGSVISVKYIMTQAGADRTTFNETLTYKGPRP